MDNKLNIDRNLSSFTPDQGVAIGNNPNQPETDIEMETTIKALRLVNVGDFGVAVGAYNMRRFIWIFFGLY